MSLDIHNQMIIQIMLLNPVPFAIGDVSASHKSYYLMSENL